MRWGVIFSAGYIFIGGYVALRGFATLETFGYGTDFKIQIKTGADPVQVYVDALLRQEKANQIRQIRNEATFQSLRNGFILFSIVLLVFAATPVLGVLKPTSKPQEITGTVQVESPALQEMSVRITKTSDALTQFEKDRGRMEEIEKNLSALRIKIAELEKQVAAEKKTGHLVSSKETARRRTQ